MGKYNTATPYIASYLILKNAEGKIAFVLRSNTDWMNNYYGLVSGKVEKHESYTEAAVREGNEEAGIDIDPNDLQVILMVHRKSSNDMYWVDAYMEVQKWKGKVRNAEPHVHSELVWFSLDDLPKNVIPSVRFGLEKIKAGKTYAEYGWEGENDPE